MKIEKNDFIEMFAEIFDETDIKELKLETIYRNLDEWSSLHALATINMMEIKYNIKISAEELKQTKTIQDLYELVISKI